MSPSAGVGGGARGAAHDWVRRWWGGEAVRGGALLAWVAAPFEWGYRGAGALRGMWEHGARARVPGVAVVSVGNLAVGGTGKTPVAAWMARVLRDAGVPVAVVTRGVGGDEVQLHRSWNADVPVLVTPDRVEGVRGARQAGCRVAVLDDGFQHRRVARDLDVVLFAAEDPPGGRLLPRGPFREPLEALGRAHVVVVTRRTASAERARDIAAELGRRHPHLQLARVRMATGRWLDLDGREVQGPGGEVLAAAGVARPEAFRAQVEERVGVAVPLLAFPDHHAFTAVDVGAMRAHAGSGTVVVTEKDAVKLRPFRAALEPVRVLAQTLVWEEGERALRERIGAVGGEMG